MRRLRMAQGKMALFARKIQFESKWNELFLKNGGNITPEMSVLGDAIKKTIREILAEQASPKNPKDEEVHLYAG
jgi:hypothetical protein